MTPRNKDREEGDYDLRKSYAVDTSSMIINQGINEQYTQSLKKLQAAEITIRDLIK